MVALDTRAVVSPVGIVRILEVIFSCVAFSLVANVGPITDSFWTWCMFVWCSCFCATLLIVVLEFTSLSSKLPISWDDFTTAFAMLAALMMLAASILFSTLFTHVEKEGNFNIIASVFSFATFILYTAEVCLTRAKPGEISGFLSTVPGLLKVLEFFVACVIFTCLDGTRYHLFPGLQWCVAIYSICFIFAAVIIILTIGRLLPLLPLPLNKVLTGCNVLAVLMYMTAVVIWPYYGFLNNPRPSICSTTPSCKWNNYPVITFMTCINLVAYIVDTVYSVRMVFFVTMT